jgi:hypothetical protein
VVVSQKIQKCIDRLEKSKILFSKEGFSKPIQQISIIINELKTTQNLTTINHAFKVLQTSFLVQYNKTSHRIQVGDFYHKRFNTVSKTNNKAFSEPVLDRYWTKVIKQRGQARKVIFALDPILKRGAKTDFDKVVSCAYIYLSIIDGIYGKNLKEFVIMHTLSQFKTPNLVQLQKMDLKKIKKFFKGVPKSSCLFDGYSDVIRNAIAHSSFWYDEKTKLINFEDRYHNRKVKITLDEFVDMVDKLSDIDIMVFYYGEIQIINLELLRAFGLLRTN